VIVAARSLGVALVLLMHFTHHDADRSHEGGWIEHAGVRYE